MNHVQGCIFFKGKQGCICPSTLQGSLCHHVQYQCIIHACIHVSLPLPVPETLLITAHLRRAERQVHIHSITVNCCSKQKSCSDRDATLPPTVHHLMTSSTQIRPPPAVAAGTSDFTSRHSSSSVLMKCVRSCQATETPLAKGIL